MGLLRHTHQFIVNEYFRPGKDFITTFPIPTNPLSRAGSSKPDLSGKVGRRRSLVAGKGMIGFY